MEQWTDRIYEEADPDTLDSGVRRTDGELLRSIVGLTGARRTLEVGFAGGFSTMYICSQLQNVPGARHVAIDPNQSTQWAARGLENVRSAGFEDLLCFYEEPSYLALPRLLSEGNRIEFAFIDGWHTFDYALVDFFYIDRMMHPGGVVALHDPDLPAIASVCRYIESNRSYELLAWVDGESRAYWSEPGKSGPSVSSLAMVAYRKLTDDARNWDFHVQF